MISIAITNFNRSDMLFESISKVIDDPRVTDIVISDDKSDPHFVNDIYDHYLSEPKVRLFRNEKNVGCYHNKKLAVERAATPFVILLDSDNIIDTTYIDAVHDRTHRLEHTILQPTFAKPHFDFREFSSLLVTRENVARYAGNETFCTALNAMNYCVNREEYLRVWEDRPEPWTADSIYMNMKWLEAGNSIYFCPGLQYEHRVHDGSHYKEHHRKTGNLYNEVVQRLKAMR